MDIKVNEDGNYKERIYTYRNRLQDFTLVLLIPNPCTSLETSRHVPSVEWYEPAVHMDQITAWYVCDAVASPNTSQTCHFLSEHDIYIETEKQHSKKLYGIRDMGVKLQSFLIFQILAANESGSMWLL
jgi:hypothetical protein